MLSLFSNKTNAGDLNDLKRRLNSYRRPETSATCEEVSKLLFDNPGKDSLKRIEQLLRSLEVSSELLDFHGFKSSREGNSAFQRTSIYYKYLNYLGSDNSVHRVKMVFHDDTATFAVFLEMYREENLRIFSCEYVSCSEINKIIELILSTIEDKIESDLRIRNDAFIYKDNIRGF